MNDQSCKKDSTAEKLWGIANEIRDCLESGKTPDVAQVGGMAIAIGVLATQVEKLATDRDGKDARLRAVLALCSRAEREGAGSDPLTAAAIRAAATGQ